MLMLTVRVLVAYSSKTESTKMPNPLGVLQKEQSKFKGNIQVPPDVETVHRQQMKEEVNTKREVLI